jgi:hypothetical protein
MPSLHSTEGNLGHLDTSIEEAKDHACGKYLSSTADLDVKLGEMASKGGTTKSELIRCAIRGSLNK